MSRVYEINSISAFFQFTYSYFMLISRPNDLVEKTSLSNENNIDNDMKKFNEC